MKKSIIPILLLSCTLLLSACTKGQTDAAKSGAPIEDGKPAQTSAVNDSQNHNITYEVTKQTYAEKNIKASYPQIIGLSDKSKQDRINEMLKKEVLTLCNSSKIDEIHAECDYEIKLQSKNVLSIVFTGYCQYNGTPHPDTLFAPFNVDLNTGSRIYLRDLVKVDEDFVKKVKAGEFKGVSPDMKLTEMPEFPNDKLLSEIKDIGSFYFTKDSLGINVVAPHQVGDNAQFEVKYQDLSNNIKAENKVWKEIIQ